MLVFNGNFPSWVYQVRKNKLLGVAYADPASREKYRQVQRDLYVYWRNGLEGRGIDY